MNNKKWQELQKIKAEKRKKRIDREIELAWQEFYRLGRRTAQTPFNKDYKKGAK
jgi:hypothetical protein